MKKVFAFSSAVLLVACSLWFVKPYYRHWKISRAVDRAAHYLAQTNLPNASLSARQALQLDTNCCAAIRILAEVAERSGSARALDLRQRVVHLAPHELSNHLELIRTALNFHALALASKSLAAIPVEQRKCKEVSELAARLAFAQGDLTEAEKQLSSAIALDPNDATNRCNLDILRLHSNDTDVVTRARVKLDAFVHENQRELALGTDALSSNTSPGLMQISKLESKNEASKRQSCMSPQPTQASTHTALSSEATARILRNLAEEALARGDALRARELSGSLTSLSGTNLEDHLLRLTALQRIAQGPGHDLTNAVNRAMQLAERDPYQVCQLVSWFVQHGWNDRAIRWIEHLPTEIRGQTAVQLAATECYVSTRRWEALTSFLDPQHWGTDDYLRHAFLAFGWHKQGDKSLSRIEWNRAVREGIGQADFGANSGNEVGPILLVRLAGAWHWEQEAEELLWTISEDENNGDWAIHLLRQAYEIGNNLPSLIRVYELMLSRGCKEPVVKNNLAAAYLLLRTNLEKAHQLAQELYRDQPTNRTFACTYAYSLHLRHLTPEARAVLLKCPTEPALSASAAAYYAVIFHGDEDSSRANVYLAQARRGPLRREEVRMLEEAFEAEAMRK